jgi:hypothetical protein
MTKKTKPSIKLGFTSGVSIISAVFIFALLLKNSFLTSIAVRDALKICATMLIPSLFPLTVASEIMTSTGAIEKLTHSLSAPVSKLLGVSKNATVPYFLGLLGGYTSSCKSAVLLYQSGKISRGDCESIIALSNIPSMAFLTGFIGVGILKSSTSGWILWIISVFSTVILGIINKFFCKDDIQFYNQTEGAHKQIKGFSKILVDAIAHSASAMLIICACVVFFSVLISVLKLYMRENLLPVQLKEIVLGTLEITKGVVGCGNIENYFHRTLACAFLVGWSGLCVHFQVIALCEDAELSFKKYFTFKALQGLICLALAWATFNFKF